MELIPPTEREVAARACALRLMLYRDALEHRADADPHDLLDAWRGTWDRLDGTLLAAITDGEAAIYAYPVGGWPHTVRRQVGWRYESLATLLFARGELECLPFDEEVDPRAVRDAIDFRASVDAMVRPLRSASEIQTLFRVTEAFRAVTSAWVKGKTARRRDRAHLEQLLAQADEGTYLSRPLGSLDEVGRSIVFSVTLERTHALRWLMGLSVADWDRVPLTGVARVDFYRDLLPLAPRDFRLAAGARRRYSPSVLDGVLLSVGFERCAEGHRLRGFRGLVPDAAPLVIARSERGPQDDTRWVDFSTPHDGELGGLGMAAALRAAKLVIEERYGEITLEG